VQRSEPYSLGAGLAARSFWLGLVERGLYQLFMSGASVELTSIRFAGVTAAGFYLLSGDRSFLQTAELFSFRRDTSLILWHFFYDACCCVAGVFLFFSDWHNNFSKAQSFCFLAALALGLTGRNSHGAVMKRLELGCRAGAGARLQTGLCVGSRRVVAVFTPTAAPFRVD